ncbi:MAG: 16S rRNA (cytidine(1402)-2'-O)-methyltransferase [Candidatus Veblenbacteria bacterium]|nr:16S rRNA (cytidine(1402)-2'-O)-methyltransferase [Candidatus Veblenbacteria bacterium]MDZ4230018.1 16S rRNA (cytidine(1402)-2'-O)-methyltransferase [Candidatus Veblenbacteria bacterium]
MAGTLYMVATPIGNLGDISERARETLRAVSLLACEDTRVTAKLLAHLELRKSLLALHHHSPARVVEQVLARLRAGEDVAYASDAGTPGLADPGGKLVQAAAQAGFAVVPIPGPSAVTAALSVAGVPANSYLFLGYPPHKKGRKKFFAEVAASSHAVVFFEATHRILKTLGELGSVVGTRPMVVCRELTKMYETVYRGTALEIVEQLKASSIKGEFVIVVAPQK